MRLSTRPAGPLMGHGTVAVASRIALILLTDLVFLDEVDERGALHLDGLTLAVVQRQHEVEEVAFAQVAGRLLLKVRTTHTQTTHTHTHTHRRHIATIIHSFYTSHRHCDAHWRN